MPQDPSGLVPAYPGIPIAVDQCVQAEDHYEHSQDVAAHVVEEVLECPFAGKEEPYGEEHRAGDHDDVERPPHDGHVMALLHAVRPRPVESRVQDLPGLPVLERMRSLECLALGNDGSHRPHLDERTFLMAACVSSGVPEVLTMNVSHSDVYLLKNSSLRLTLGASNTSWWGLQKPLSLRYA